MKHNARWLAVSLLMTGSFLTACQRPPRAHQADHPVEVEAIKGLAANRVTMTEKAIERIALKTDVVREQQTSRSASLRTVVPDSALIYDPTGQTWIYTSPQPRTFIRQKVDVDYVEGGLAVLNGGPPIGTVVVSMAAAEVYGADSGVGH